MINLTISTAPALHLSSAGEVRSLCRSGGFTGKTSGSALGFIQANLMIVPREYAYDFLLFCQRNPKPCPLIEILETGNPAPHCAPEADLRTDLPAYRVFRDGKFQEERSDIVDLWQDDFVSFLIGCSYSFEAALLRNGIQLRHIENKHDVAMYRTNRKCVSAGKMKGDMVVSMRPIKSRDVAQVVEICARYPDVHGAPVHIGHPHALGIENLSNPDFGDSIELLDDEVPVFWACGVTPQIVALESSLPFCITHSPGKMFITDLPLK